MPAALTLYVKNHFSQLDIREIQRGTSNSDWLLIGELHNLSERQANRFIDLLTWSNQPLRVGRKGERPIDIQYWTESSAVSTFVEEAMSENSPPRAIRDHLRHAKAVISLEIGFNQVDAMLGAVAFEIACRLAEAHAGVILDWNGSWFKLVDGSWKSE